MTEVSQDQPRKPGEKFGELRRRYVPIRQQAGKILEEAGVTGVPFKKARARVARELLKGDIDEVTQLPVRRRFEKELREEVERGRRFGHPLTMVIIDLNNLKKINDNNGYPAGDEALKTIAKMLDESKRDIDFVARYGGDEFALLLVETPVQDIEKWWERFVGKIKEMPYTVSAGATEVNLGNIDGTRDILSDLVTQAKKEGQHVTNHLIKHFPD